MEKHLTFLKMLFCLLFSFTLRTISSKLLGSRIGHPVPAEGASDFLRKTLNSTLLLSLVQAYLQQIEKMHRKFTATAFLSCVCIKACSRRGGSDKCLKVLAIQTCALHVFPALLLFVALFHLLPRLQLQSSPGAELFWLIYWFDGGSH